METDTSSADLKRNVGGSVKWESVYVLEVLSFEKTDG